MDTYYIDKEEGRWWVKHAIYHRLLECFRLEEHAQLYASLLESRHGAEARRAPRDIQIGDDKIALFRTMVNIMRERGMTV